MEAAAMHLHVYRDESHSGHVDLVGEGEHPWSIDLVTVIAAAIMFVGFAAALAVHFV
jgi:hypothetical protein